MTKEWKNRHILLIGEPGVGKSTLINRLLAGCSLPLYGFRTKKGAASPDRMAPIYMTPLAKGAPWGEPILVGMGMPKGPAGNPAAFDEAAKYLLHLPEDCLVLMDELGVMENEAQVFQRAVLEVLNSPRYVICAVKTRPTPFLEAVRTHPRATGYPITPENREALYEELAALHLFF